MNGLCIDTDGTKNILEARSETSGERVSYAQLEFSQNVFVLALHADFLRLSQNH